MSDSNALVKLFGNLMGSLDEDDEKKKAEFTPDGVPTLLARPPEVVPEYPTPVELTPEEQAWLAANGGVPVPEPREVPAPVQQGVPELLARPQPSGEEYIDPDAPPGFDPSKLVPDPITPEEQAMLASEQGVPELLARPQPSLGFDGVPLMGEIETPPPAQEDPYGHLDWGDATKAGFPSWMTDPLDTASAAKAPEAIKNIDERLVELEGLRDRGEISPEGYTQQAEVLKRHRQSHENMIAQQETNLKDRDLYKVKRLYDAGLTDQAEALAAELGLPSPSGVPPVELNEDGVPVMIARPEGAPSAVTQEDVDADNAVVNSEENAEGKKLLDQELDNSDLSEKEENLENEETKESFLSKLWDGVKDVIVTQFKDPVNQKAMFAYAISRALGYDGSSLAGKVLEDGWSRQAALEKAGLDQLAKTQQKAAENAVINYDKPVTVFNPKTQQNTTAYFSKDKQQVMFEDETVNGGQPLSVGRLHSIGWTLGEGTTEDDHRQVMVSTLTEDINTVYNQMAKEDLDDKTLQAFQAAIAPRELKIAINNFMAGFPKGTDFTNSQVMDAISSGASNYLVAIREGRAVGSKDLSGYLDYEMVKADVSDSGVRPGFWAIEGGDDGQLIGINGWSQVNSTVGKLQASINKRIVAEGGQPMTKPEIYKALEGEFYVQMAANADPEDPTDNPFSSHWRNVSDESAGDKEEALSPVLSWMKHIDKQIASPSYRPPSGSSLVSELVKDRLKRK